MTKEQINYELNKFEKFRTFLINTVQNEQKNSDSGLDIQDFQILKSFINSSISAEQDYLCRCPDDYQELYLNFFNDN